MHFFNLTYAVLFWVMFHPQNETLTPCHCELIIQDDTPLELYETPQGNFVQRFSFQKDVQDFDFGKVLEMDAFQNGWFRIAEDLPLKSGENLKAKWIRNHHTFIASNNYSGQSYPLRSLPERDAEVTNTFSKEIVFPVKACSNKWLKVKTDNLQGWLAPEFQCPNDVTNCN